MISSDGPKSGITLQGDGSVTGSYSTMMIFDSTSSGKYFMGATTSGWTAGSNKFLFGKNDPASTNTIMAMDGANSRIGIGNTSPSHRLTFSNSLESKICLYGDSSNMYGFGVNSNTLNYHVMTVSDSHTFITMRY